MMSVNPLTVQRSPTTAMTRETYMLSSMDEVKIATDSKLT